MRQLIKDQEIGLDPNFRYRGKNQTRIETFSDAAFALAITLLVLSSSVPNTLTALIDSMRNVLPFGICVTLLAIIWYQHYLFFIRYGLQSVQTVVANTFLLFLILVYVYPLKFLMRFLFEFYFALISDDWSRFQNDYVADLTADNMAILMIVYGLGAAMIFLTLAWLYKYAMRKKDELELSEFEFFQTRSSMIMNLIQAGIPLLSVLVALFFGRKTYGLMFSGYIYMLYPIVLPVFSRIFEKKRKILIERLNLK